MSIRTSDTGERICSTCHRPFHPKTHNQRFCSSTCRDRLLGRRKRQRRGTTSEAGYGYQHQQLRARWKPIVQAGQAYCWRPSCKYLGTPLGRWIPPDQPGQPTGWHVGHDDHDRSITRGPEHAACNTSTAATNGNRRRATSSAPRIAR